MISCPNCGFTPTIQKGSRVRIRAPKRGQTRQVGIVKRKPRANAKTAYVVWPNAWAGPFPIAELEVA